MRFNHIEHFHPQPFSSLIHSVLSLLLFLTLNVLPPQRFPADLGHPKIDTQTISQHLLNLVNEERAQAGVRPVALDEFASRIAEAHARDMAEYGYCSHWGRDGRKPYMRYSFAGRADATAENVASLSGLPPPGAFNLDEYVTDLHLAFYEEKPPTDGHRRTILNPRHTHVGFGLAAIGNELRLVEEFVGRYVEVEPLPRQVQRQAGLSIHGRLLSPSYRIHCIDAYYEPLPTPPDPAWLRVARSYGLPQTKETFFPDSANSPRLATGSLSSGAFSTRIKLFKDAPGIYTIVVWVKEFPSSDAFPATHLCLQAD